MPVDLHLFSNPGINNISFILEACRPYLEVQARPVLAFMQWASVNRDWLDYTQKTFSGIAEVVAFLPDPALIQKNERILDLCGVVYISGGNTFLLNHLLHTSDLIEGYENEP
jgi:peptidase E